MVERLLGIGTITLTTRDTEEPELTLYQIPHARKVFEYIQSQIPIAAKQRGGRTWRSRKRPAATLKQTHGMGGRHAWMQVRRCGARGGGAFRGMRQNQPNDPLKRAHESVGYINGTATVVSIDKPLGHAVLDIAGKTVEAYWLTESMMAVQMDPETTSTGTPLQPQVGQYQPPVARTEDFNAAPGDTIAFVGLKTGDDILLRGIRVIGHPR